MRILLTNDDGYHAPGLKVLERIAAAFSDDVWIVEVDRGQLHQRKVTLSVLGPADLALDRIAGA